MMALRICGASSGGSDTVWTTIFTMKWHSHHSLDMKKASQVKWLLNEALPCYTPWHIQCSTWVARRPRPSWSLDLARQSLQANRANYAQILAMADVPVIKTHGCVFWIWKHSMDCCVVVLFCKCLNHPSVVLSFLAHINIAWEGVHKGVVFTTNK